MKGEKLKVYACRTTGILCYFRKMRSPPFLFALVAAFLAFSPAFAEEAGQQPNQDILPVMLLKEGGQAADTTHEYLSDRMEELARQLDSFLGGKQALDEDTGSYFSGRLSYSYVRGLPAEWRFDSKLLLVLPRTQDRFDLEFDTEKFIENLNTGSGARVTPPGAEDEKTSRTGSLFAGIRALLFRSDKWRATLGSGVRVVWPPDPYGKMNISYRTPANGWTMRIENGVFWYLAKGWSDRATLVFSRPALKESTINVASVGFWTDQGEGWRLGETVSLLTPLNDDTAVATRVGGIWETQPLFLDIEYFTDFTVRKRIYSTWLFAEGRASLAWPRGSGFEPTPGVFLTLEMFMGGKKRGMQVREPLPKEMTPPVPMDVPPDYYEKETIP